MKLHVFAEKENFTKQVGTIETVPGKGACFSYCENWLGASNTKPLSLSLPLITDSFSERSCRPYFDGLLPEGRIRSNLAKQLHVSERSFVKILAGLGWECIGAVSFADPFERPKSGYRPINKKEFDGLIHKTVELGILIDGQMRFSLAGAQPKLALYRDNKGNWYEPLGGAPSTHIIKPAHNRYNDICINEALCMTALAEMGINIPSVCVIEGSTPLFVAERFDRSIDQTEMTEEGLAKAHRLHQEDFSQALSIPPEHKYETGSDHTYLKKMFNLLRNYSDAPIEDMQRLWDGIVVAFLIGDCDAHLKNFAIMRDRSWHTLRLAPFYDFISTVAYEGLSHEMALSIGRKRLLEEIDREAFARQAEDLLLDQTWALARVEKLASQLPDAFEMAVQRFKELGVDDAGVFFEQIAPGIEKRCASLL